MAGSAAVLLCRRAMVQRTASPQHSHRIISLVRLHGDERSPVAGGGAAG